MNDYIVCRVLGCAVRLAANIIEATRSVGWIRIYVNTVSMSELGQAETKMRGRPRRPGMLLRVVSLYYCLSNMMFRREAGFPIGSACKGIMCCGLNHSLSRLKLKNITI